MTKVTGSKKNIPTNNTEELNIVFHKRMRDEIEKMMVNDPPYGERLGARTVNVEQAWLQGEDKDILFCR
jgi:hypothetical protein